MKKMFLLICCSLAMLPVSSQDVKCAEPPLFDPMPKHLVKDCWTEYLGVMMLKEKNDSGQVNDVIIKGPFAAVRYRYTGDAAKRPKSEQVMKYYAALIKKEGGAIQYQDKDRVDARIRKNNKDYWVNVAFTLSSTAPELRLSTIQIVAEALVDEVPVAVPD